MARPILQLEASHEELAELGRLVRGSKVSVRDRFRANIILRRLEGKSETEIAKELGCSLGAVCKWSKRFDEKGISGLKDAPALLQAWPFPNYLDRLVDGASCA